MNQEHHRIPVLPTFSKKLVDALSEENIRRIQQLNRIILDQIELQEIGEPTWSVRLPRNLLRKEGYEYSELEILIGVLNKINLLSSSPLVYFPEYENRDAVTHQSDHDFVVQVRYPLSLKKLEKRLGDYLAERINPKSIKIKIIIDEYGIRLKDEPKKSYEIRGTRKKLIDILLKTKTIKLATLAHKLGRSQSNVSKDIVTTTSGSINNIFRKHLDLRDDLILHSNSSGYYLNKETYEIN